MFSVLNFPTKNKNKKIQGCNTMYQENKYMYIYWYQCIRLKATYFLGIKNWIEIQNDETIQKGLVGTVDFKVYEYATVCYILYLYIMYVQVNPCPTYVS